MNKRTGIAILFAALSMIGGCTSMLGPSKNASIEVSMPPVPDSTLSPLFALCEGDTCSCACDDPFDPRQRFRDGDFAGKCLNSCWQRSVKYLSPPDNARYGYFPDSTMESSPGDEMLFLVNVSHFDSLTGQPLFCAAMIPLAAVREAIVQIEYAGGLRAHAQMRFTLDPLRPALLVPQRTDLPRVTYREHNLIFSAEAVAPPGTPYKGDYGMRSQYVQSYRFETIYPRASKMIRLLKHPVAQYRLDLEPGQAGQILAAAARMGDRFQYARRYHTVKRNCILEVFAAIDQVVKPAWWRRPQLVFTNRTLFMPTRAPHHLRYRGLDSSDPSRFRIENFEDELGWAAFVTPRLKQELEEKAAKW